ncbi:MAG: hypothetical protein LBV51_02755, partial [Acholeplasmatales bacterium]|nr:hypothetical protein [Acholeplasmatales bacterium]
MGKISKNTSFKINKKIVFFSIAIILSTAIFINVIFLNYKNSLYAYDPMVFSNDTPYSYTKEELDAYTNNDSLLNPNNFESNLTISDYKTDLYKRGSNTSINNSKISVVVSNDDPIVKIVPRQFFEHSGTYLYIGNEYGIFVKTDKISEFSNQSVAFIFDVIRKNGDQFTSSKYDIEIRPLFQYRYFYLTRTDNFNPQNKDIKYDVDSNLSSIVTPAPTLIYKFGGKLSYKYEQITVYSLKDVSIRISLYNEQEKNYGDSGYIPNNDNGSFIVKSSIKFSGEGINNKNKNDISSKIKLQVGNVPLANSKKAEDEYKKYFTSITNNDFTENKKYGEFFSSNLYISKIEQLNNYKILTKSSYVELLSNDKKPLLFGINENNNYVRASFELGMTENWYTRILSTIELSVVSKTKKYDGKTIINTSITNGCSSKNNIRSIKTTELFLESTQMFSLMPEGETRFSFNALNSSEYSITIEDSSNVKVSNNDVNVSFVDNTAKILLLSGENIINIINLNTRRVDSSIIILSDSSSSSTPSKSIFISGNENYLLKVTELSEVKVLSANNSDFGISRIYINSNFEPYVSHGSIYSTSELSHPFSFGDYYIVIKNMISLSRTIDFTISEPDVIILNTPKSFIVKSEN